jgi:hypothetical protein
MVKDELTKWWLKLIDLECEAFLLEHNYDTRAFDEGTYIDQPPANLDACKRNLAFVQELLKPSGGKFSAEHVVESLMTQIYEAIDDFILKARVVLSELVLGEPLNFDVPFDLKPIRARLDSKRDAMNSNAEEATQWRQLDGLIKDLDYLTEMKELELAQAAKKKDPEREVGKLALTHVVPVSGLAMGYFFRLENVLKTVIELWDRPEPTEPSPDVESERSKSESFSAPVLVSNSLAQETSAGSDSSDNDNNNNNDDDDDDDDAFLDYATATAAATTSAGSASSISNEELSLPDRSTRRTVHMTEPESLVARKITAPLRPASTTRATQVSLPPPGHANASRSRPAPLLGSLPPPPPRPEESPNLPTQPPPMLAAAVQPATSALPAAAASSPLVPPPRPAGPPPSTRSPKPGVTRTVTPGTKIPRRSQVGDDVRPEQFLLDNIPLEPAPPPPAPSPTSSSPDDATPTTSGEEEDSPSLPPIPPARTPPTRNNVAPGMTPPPRPAGPPSSASRRAIPARPLPARPPNT